MLSVASHWKATIHTYHYKKFQKFYKYNEFRAACPESLSPTYGSPMPLGASYRVQEIYSESSKRQLGAMYLEASK
jgi:hypothetical protein